MLLDLIVRLCLKLSLLYSIRFSDVINILENPEVDGCCW